MPTAVNRRSEPREKVAGGFRVLVISNEADTNKAYQGALKRIGIATRSARSLPAALNQLSETEYHLIILDLDLPGTEGAEPLRKLRSTGNRTPVIVLSGNSSMKTAMECGRLEVFEYLEKPVMPETVLEAARSFGERMGKIQNILVSIGKNVRRLRNEAGLTLKVLAEKADTSISLISHVELARASASIGTLLRIATALGVDIKTLFDEPR